MLNKLMESLESHDPDETAEHAFQRHVVAAAALLVELSRADTDFDPHERATIVRLVRDHFRLTPEQSDALVAIAERRQDEAYTDFMFTQAISEHYSQAEHVTLVTMLWEVAYADGNLHEFEDQLVRRVAQSLSLSEGQCETARRKAIESLGLSKTV